jgi:hypothetical protein
MATPSREGCLTRGEGRALLREKEELLSLKGDK